MYKIYTVHVKHFYKLLASMKPARFNTLEP